MIWIRKTVESVTVWYEHHDDGMVLSDGPITHYAYEIVNTEHPSYKWSPSVNKVKGSQELFDKIYPLQSSKDEVNRAMAQTILKEAFNKLKNDKADEDII